MPNRLYLRPLPIGDPDILKQLAPANGAAAGRRALPLAGGPLSFASVEVIRRGEGGGAARSVAPIDRAPALFPDDPAAYQGWARAVSAPRPAVAGLSLERPLIMGVLNVTPDSFSDGGRHADVSAAVAAGAAMAAAGADILDVGGESTRPGADEVTIEQEIARTVPVILGLREAGVTTPISIDTRKARVAQNAFAAGARIFNDVSALSFDPDNPRVAAELCDQFPDAGVVLCHSPSDPKTMQSRAVYDDVVADIYDALAERIAVCAEAGVPADRLIVDPGIGFGKTLAHNLALIRGLAVFHGLGAPVLLGASRKRFIGTLSGETLAERRGPGSIAVALMGAAKGAQILRVHDVAETAQALAVWRALTLGDVHDYDG